MTKRTLIGGLVLMALLSVVQAALATHSNPRGKDISATAGQSFSGVVAVFYSGGKDPDNTAYTATVDWGDGTPPTSGEITPPCGACNTDIEVRGTHTYSEPGTYTVRTTIDYFGEQIVAEGTATVTAPAQEPPPPPPPPPPPSVTLSAPARAAHGVPVHLSAGGSGEGLTYAWDLDGDGAFETRTGSTPFLDHTFPTAGEKTVAVQVTDSHGATAVSKASHRVNRQPLFLLALPKSGAQKGKATKLTAIAGADAKAPIAYYEWRFLDGGKTGGKHKLGDYVAANGSKLTKGGSIKHVFTGKNPTFVVTAHATDGGLSTAVGQMKFVPGGGDYITAFAVSGIPNTATGVDVYDISTEPSNKIIKLKTVCDILGVGNQQDCVTLAVDHNPHEVAGFAVKGPGSCTSCPHTDSPADIDVSKPGVYEITMTVKRTVPKVTEKVSMDVEVTAATCDPISVRGIEVDPVGCLIEVGGHYVTTQSVSVGGLDVSAPSEGGSLEIVPAQGTIAAPPGAPPLVVEHEYEPFRKVKLYEGPGFTIPQPAGGTAAMPASFTQAVADKKPKVRGFTAASATAELKTTGPAQVTYWLELPQPVATTAPLTVSAGETSQTGGGSSLPPFSIGPIDIDFVPGLVALRDLELGFQKQKYQGDPDSGWRGGGDIEILEKGRISAAYDEGASPFPTGFRLGDGGSFKWGGAKYTLPPPGIALGSTGAFLEAFGAYIQVDPFVFNGSATIGAASVFTVEGCVALVVAKAEHVGKEAPFCVDQYGNPAKYAIAEPGLAVRISGSGSLVGIPIPANMYGQWTPAGVSVRGRAAYTLPLISEAHVALIGEVFGDFQSASSWQAGVTMKVEQNILCLAKYCPPLSQAGGVISSKGVAVCGPIPVVQVPLGVWVLASGSVGAFPFLCEVAFDQVKIETASAALAPAGGDPFARIAAQSQDAVRLQAGAPFALLEVRGRDAAPLVEVTGPGVKVREQPEQRLDRARPLVFRSDTQKTTFVYLPSPRSASYTVQTLDGSSPIAGVSVEYGLRAPRIRAKVRRGALRYDVRADREQKVTFFEEARGFQAPIGVARGRRGRIRFTPSPTGPAGRRRVVALVEQNGLPRSRDTVATFRARRPAPPARPVVRARRRGSTLRVDWTPVPRARAYRIEATIAGRTETKVVRGRSAAFGSFPVDAAASVRVRGVDARGRLGVPAKGRVKRRNGARVALRLG